MKSKIIILLLSLLVCATGQSQTNIFEINPSFTQVSTRYISEVIDFNPSFADMSFVGISAYHFDEDYKGIEYRVLHEGEWSGWQRFSPQHEVLERVRTAYEGQFIREAFNAIQFRTEDVLETPLTVRLFIGRQSKTELVVPQKSVLCDQPEICDRTCWCADCPIDATPQLTVPTHVIVHHSAGSNDPDLNFTDVVNYIWDLHVGTNGWDDIGYNWLVDPDGIIYEGRPDGYQGAHFSCINENTIGICMLGDFTSIAPSEAAANTLVNLVAFEMTDHNIDVLGESYHETGEFILTNLAGHRDSSGSDNSCSATACPGDTFYPMLDSIRIKVADLECYQNSVSTTQVEAMESWSVYPNPFTSSITVHNNYLDDVVVELKDVRGVSVASLVAGQSHDLSHLLEGVYFVVVEGRVVERVVKL